VFSCTFVCVHIYLINTDYRAARLSKNANWAIFVLTAVALKFVLGVLFTVAYFWASKSQGDHYDQATFRRCWAPWLSKYLAIVRESYVISGYKDIFVFSKASVICRTFFTVILSFVYVMYLIFYWCASIMHNVLIKSNTMYQKHTVYNKAAHCFL